jgi:hypothetical protein
MQTQNDRTIDALMEQLIESGPDGLAAAVVSMLNLAMRMERERTCRRTDTFRPLRCRCLRDRIGAACEWRGLHLSGGGSMRFAPGRRPSSDLVADAAC